MFTRGITYCVTVILAALVCRGVGGGNGRTDDVLMSLWRVRKAETDAGSQIIKAMEDNNLSSFELVKDTFAHAPVPELKSHSRETLYTGWCWNPIEVETPIRSSLNSYIVNAKLRIVPDWAVDDLEVGTSRLRTRHHEEVRGLASSYDVILKRVNDTNKLARFKASLHNSWIESSDVEAFQLRDHDTFSGAGFVLERLCIKENGCELLDHPIPRGATLSYCIYARTALESAPKPTPLSKQRRLVPRFSKPPQKQ